MQVIKRTKISIREKNNKSIDLGLWPGCRETKIPVFRRAHRTSTDQRQGLKRHFQGSGNFTTFSHVFFFIDCSLPFIISNKTLKNNCRLTYCLVRKEREAYLKSFFFSKDNFEVRMILRDKVF